MKSCGLIDNRGKSLWPRYFESFSKIRNQGPDMENDADEKTWTYSNKRASNYPPIDKQVAAKREQAYQARMDIVVKAEETKDFIPLKSKDSHSQIEADNKDDKDWANRVGLWEKRYFVVQKETEIVEAAQKIWCSKYPDYDNKDRDDWGSSLDEWNTIMNIN
jgi:hypothetical protein